MRILVLIALLCSSAFADEREDREEARKEFAAGQASDKKRDYAEAIEHYMRANDLVPHPFAMYNIAVDFERIGKLREAATWYERYLDNASTKEADRERVNRLLIDLRNKPAKVSVTSNPDGARVIINGIPSGSTPYKGELKGGMYRIAIEKGDERDFKEVTVEYGEPVEVQFALRGAIVSTPATTTPTTTNTTEIRRPPPPRGAAGTLVVRGEPYGALVAVDNVPVGTLPTQLPVEVGTHTVRITADGFSPYEQEVTITPSGQTPVDARLSRALGTLNPSGPSIRVGYLLGGGGGVDARGSGTMILVEAGLRASKYDLSARLGKLSDNDVTVVDLMVRWALTKTRLAPYIGGGYSFVTNGYGYTFFGGLRLDVVDTERFGMSIMAESGFRFYSSTDTSTDTSASTTGSIVPIMASLLLRYR